MAKTMQVTPAHEVRLSDGDVAEILDALRTAPDASGLVAIDFDGLPEFMSQRARSLYKRLDGLPDLEREDGDGWTAEGQVQINSGITVNEEVEI